jgi:hypothetical protein
MLPAPDKYHFCVAIVACGKARRPQQALELLTSAQETYDITPNRQMYTAAIQACADSGWWFV